MQIYLISIVVSTIAQIGKYIGKANDERQNKLFNFRKSY